MTEREQVEQQIHEVLASEMDAISLSNKLFSPGGLFNQLASTEEERRVVAQSTLFKQAQRHLTHLQQREASEFARVVQQAQASRADDKFLLKLERSDHP